MPWTAGSALLPAAGIKFGFRDIDYININITSKGFFGKKKETIPEPNYRSRLDRLMNDINEECRLYKNCAEAKNKEDALNHLMKAFALSGVVRRHGRTYNWDLLAEFYY